MTNDDNNNDNNNTFVCVTLKLGLQNSHTDPGTTHKFLYHFSPIASVVMK